MNEDAEKPMGGGEQKDRWDRILEREDLRTRIRAILDFLGTDELQLVGRLAARVSLGRARYGEWVAANDGRDLSNEQLEEYLDAMAYGAMRALR